MLAGAAWMGAGFLVLSQVSSLVQFGAMTALFVGLGTGTIGTAANSKLMVEWFDRRRGLALSVAITGYAIAGIVMAPVAVFLLEQVGWRGAYLLFGGVLLLAVLPLVALLVRDRSSHTGFNTKAAAASSEVQLKVFLSFARSPAFWSCVLIFGSMAAVLGGLSLHLFLHFTDKGIGNLQAASLLSLEGVFALASKPLFGALIDRIGARNATVIAVFGCLFSLVVLFTAAAYTVWLVAAALIGLSFGAVIPLQAALLSRLFGEKQFARAYGSLRLATFPLVMGGPLLLGYVHDLTSSYSVAFALFAVLFGGVLIAAWLLQPVSATNSAAS
jgi:MFS family permease